LPLRREGLLIARAAAKCDDEELSLFRFRLTVDERARTREGTANRQLCGIAQKVSTRKTEVPGEPVAGEVCVARLRRNVYQRCTLGITDHQGC
jgi:hypothetical protein